MRTTEPATTPAQRFRCALLACAALGGIAGCAGMPRVLATAAGHYDTQRQFEAAAPELRREPAAGHPYDWLDRQHAVFRWVEAPRLGRHVMYLEWRSGGAEGPISRQRLWVFERRDNAWVMDFYTLRNGAAGEPQSRLADDFSEVRSGDLVGYGDRCTLGSVAQGRALEFSIPASCEIVSRGGRSMRLAATVRFEPGAIRYREQGLLGDGAYAFLVPGQPGLDYHFERADGPLRR